MQAAGNAEWEPGRQQAVPRGRGWQAVKGSDSDGFLGLRDGGQSPGGGETRALAPRVRLGGPVKDFALGPSFLEALPGGVSA